jgi:thioredoxin 1
MIQINESNYVEEVQNSKELVVIDFYADWCGPCRAISGTLQSLQDKAKIVKVNIDNNQSISDQFKVSAIPTLVFMKDGVEHDRFVGAKSKKDIESKIDELK